MRRPDPAMGKRLLFWDDQAGDLQPLLDLLGDVPGGRKYDQPKDHVRADVPWEDRQELARALQERTTIFVRPEKADHYVLIHKVWTKECDEMLAAVRRARRRVP